MSLAQRRTAGEGVNLHPTTSHQDGETTSASTHLSRVASRTTDEEWGDGGAGQGQAKWRTVSYDAFPPPEMRLTQFPDPAALTHTEPHKGAYNVSVAKRGAQVAFAVLACALASGIVCGFAALKPILVAEGVYADLCAEPEASSSMTTSSSPATPCPAQDMRLNLFFTAASVALNVSTVGAGYVLDHRGRRACYIVSALLLAAGAGLMSHAFARAAAGAPVAPPAAPWLDGFVAANVLLGLGGTFLFVASFQLAHAFPRRAGVVVALVTGAFDASAAVFLFYRWAYEAFPGAPALKPRAFFAAFAAVVPALIVLAEFALMPAHPYHDRPELERRLEKARDATRDVHASDEDEEGQGEEDESTTTTSEHLRRVRADRRAKRLQKLDRIETVTGDLPARRRRERRAERHQDAAGVWGVLHGLPLRRQLATPWFGLMLASTALQMLRMNYFIATVRAQYRYMLDSEALAARVNGLFDVALPLAGVATTPAIGVLLNESSVEEILGTVTGLIVVLGVLNCLPYLWAGYASVVAFVLFRPLYYSVVSDYTTKVFGFATFGRIFGAITTVSGLCNLVQPGLDYLTHAPPLAGNPVPINLAFAIAGAAVSGSLTAYVHVRGKAFRRAQQELEEAREREDADVDERVGLLGGARGADGAYGTVA